MSEHKHNLKLVSVQAPVGAKIDDNTKTNINLGKIWQEWVLNIGKNQKICCTFVAVENMYPEWKIFCSNSLSFMTLKSKTELFVLWKMDS